MTTPTQTAQKINKDDLLPLYKEYIFLQKEKERIENRIIEINKWFMEYAK